MDYLEKIKVLYVDDEIQNLLSFKSNFGRIYNVITTTNPHEALAIIEGDPDISIILSDDRMPEMTGIEFFKILRELYPEKIRILITGYANIDSALSAINESMVYRYIEKPWEFNDVKNSIENGYQYIAAIKEIKKKNVELKTAYNELDKFVYSTSHDLRAPLASILGLINLIKIEEDKTQHEYYLELMESCVDTLDTFVKNILYYYKGKRANIQNEQIIAEKLMMDIINELKFLPNKESIQFNTLVKGNSEFYSDSLNIRTIVSNLVSNAIKFQDPNKEENKIDIEIDADISTVKINIKDNGVGIPESSKAKIFDMFFRSTYSGKGSGLGLYIVKETVDKLGGEISVNSTENEGTVFSVVVPNLKDKDQNITQ